MLSKCLNPACSKPVRYFGELLEQPDEEHPYYPAPI
jgi:hypothetical protein